MVLITIFKSLRYKIAKIFDSIFAVIAVIIGNLYAESAFAEGANNIGDIAATIVASFYNVGRLMVAVSYMAGIGFTIASIFKFKQHRDNPTQIPVGTPIALLALGIILIFLPGIIAPVGGTLFGTEDLEPFAGGFTGKGANNLPGGQ